MKIFVNCLTISRFVVALFLPWMKYQYSSYLFLCVLVLLFLTDTIDGFLARKFQVQTFFGALMDTIADKALNIILLLCLLSSCPLLWVILLGEIIIFGINSIAFLTGKRIQASIFGKAKMWLVAFSILFGYLYEFQGCDYSWVVSGAVLAFVSQLITIVNYVQTLFLHPTFVSKKKEKVPFQTLLFDTQYYLENRS